MSIFCNKVRMVIDIHVDTGACNGCGLCVKDCPMHVYELRDNIAMPVKAGDCMGCLSCHEICPTQALEHRGVYPSRRHYIDLRVCEMLKRVI
jgi:NAD-dependent dihydropyrimidine dehydrogenase PreA subunit